MSRFAHCRFTPLNQPDVMPIFDVLQASTKGGGAPVERYEGVTTGSMVVDALCMRFINFRRLMCEYLDDYNLARAATKVVVKKEKKRRDDSLEEDLSDVDLEDEEFDDDEPLFLQKQKKAAGRGAAADGSRSSGRKRTVNRKYVDESDEEEEVMPAKKQRVAPAA